MEQPRTTQRYNKGPVDDEDFLNSRIIELASQYGCYGYRRVTALLRNEGWIVNHKRVERIWRREGLKVHQKQPNRGRQWLNDGSVVRLKPLFPQHVWSYDFMQARTHNGVPFRILNVITYLKCALLKETAHFRLRKRQWTDPPNRPESTTTKLKVRLQTDTGFLRPRSTQLKYSARGRCPVDHR